MINWKARYIIISHRDTESRISRIDKIEYYDIEQVHERFADFNAPPTNDDHQCLKDSNLLTICQNRGQVNRFINNSNNEDDGVIYKINPSAISLFESHEFIKWLKRSIRSLFPNQKLI